MKILLRKFASVFGAQIVVFLLIGAGCSTPSTSESRDKTSSIKSAPQPKQTAMTGQKLFLKNCAHCHGADASGDEGPDLHSLDWSDEQIARRIRVGKKGQMTAFAGKLSDDEIRDVIGYLRDLK
jgi:mono/diheme cytochrome c family protein